MLSPFSPKYSFCPYPPLPKSSSFSFIPLPLPLPLLFSLFQLSPPYLSKKLSNPIPSHPIPSQSKPSQTKKHSASRIRTSVAALKARNPTYWTNTDTASPILKIYFLSPTSYFNYNTLLYFTLLYNILSTPFFTPYSLFPPLSSLLSSPLISPSPSPSPTPQNVSFISISLALSSLLSPLSPLPSPRSASKPPAPNPLTLLYSTLLLSRTI